MSIPTTNLSVFFKNVEVDVTSGIFSYGTVGSIPNTLLNTPGQNFRMWNFCLAMELSPTPDNEYTITIDGTQIAPKPVQISFEGKLSGIMTVQSKTFNAHKYITYSWDAANPFVIQLHVKLPCQITRQTFVYLNININDCSLANQPCGK